MVLGLKRVYFSKERQHFNFYMNSFVTHNLNILNCDFVDQKTTQYLEFSTKSVIEN